MLHSTAYTIRAANGDDRAALERLAVLESQPPLRGPVLLGEVDGVPTAALSLADGRVVADIYKPTLHLTAHLRMRAEVLGAHRRTPSLAERLRAAVVVRRPQAA